MVPLASATMPDAPEIVVGAVDIGAVTARAGQHAQDDVLAQTLRVAGGRHTELTLLERICKFHINAYMDLRTALSTRVLPNDQIAPGTLWLEAMTESNAVSIQER